MKICILTIATNKYIQFVERLLDNVEENFLNGHEIECLLFTDHEVETSDNVKVSQIDHKPWPHHLIVLLKNKWGILTTHMNLKLLP
jgi:hypothetical protein